MIRAGSSWCDLVKHSDGRVEFVHLRGTTVVCENAQTGEVRWSVNAGRPLLYLRAAADDTGRVCAIGQGHDDGQAWAVVEGGEPMNLGPTHGVFPVLIFGDSLGWVAIIQRTADTYDTVRLKKNGGFTKLLTHAMPPTSQGFLYVADDGAPVTQDRGRNMIPGLALPSPGDFDTWAGQSTTAATIALYDRSTLQITPLGTPGGQPPHIVESGGTYYVCSYVDGGAWLSMHRRPFAAATPPPVEPPPVDPGEPDMSVQDVPNRLDAVEQAEARYPVAWFNCHRDYGHQGEPGKTTVAQAEEFIRRLAYDLHQQDRRFGLNGKRATSTLSQDALCFRHDDGRESVIDVVNGAGGSNPTPGWSVVGHYRPAGDGQRWIQPEAVGGSTPAPGPTPTPTPAPAPKPFPSFRVPEDIFLHAYTTYIGGLYARDQIDEPGGWKVASRGATMWFVPIFYEKILALISRKGNQLPTPNEWWDLADEGARAAIDFYRRTAPPE